MSTDPRITNIAEFLRRIHQPGDLFELRGLAPKDADGIITWLGNDPDRAAKVALWMESRGANVYYTLNPVFLGSDFAIRYPEKNKPFIHARWTARDNHIECRNLLLIDIDPIRPSGTASTNGQRRAAGSTAMKVRDYLTSRGWPLPTILDSGNGVHLLYAIQRVNVEQAVVKHALREVGLRFNDATCKIDSSVSNAARISRLPGVLNRKAQRRSRVLSYTNSDTRVSLHQIMELAQEGGYRPDSHSRGASLTTCKLDCDGVEDLIEAYPEILELDRISYDGKLTYFALSSCPFKGAAHVGMDSGHGKTAIIHRQGSIGFQCFSDDCASYTFRDLLRHLERKTGRKPPMDEIYEDVIDLEALGRRWGGIEIVRSDGKAGCSEEEYWVHLYDAGDWYSIPQRLLYRLLTTFRLPHCLNPHDEGDAWWPLVMQVYAAGPGVTI